MANLNIYEKVTNRIIEQLEQGIIPWKKPWYNAGLNIKGAEDLREVAFNRVSKMAYSPLNQMLLSKPGEYASFKQWHELGGKIRKGAKAEIVVFWKMLNIEEIIDEQRVIKKIPLLRYLPVFHIDDIEGVEPLKIKEAKPGDCFDVELKAEEIIQNYKTRENVKICYGGNDAYYSPIFDEIHVPERFQFGKKTEEYYSTIFHEMVHSTGASHRLNRLTITAHFGDNDYSNEELVAEIGASGLLNLLNIETKTTFKNSVAYIQNWITQLKNDTKLIVSASTKAEKAINYIFNGKQEDIQGAV